MENNYDETQEVQSSTLNLEPESFSENSDLEQEGQVHTEENEDSQSESPSELILGKFKSVEDLSKAYQELQQKQGRQSNELGDLRQSAAKVENVVKAWKHLDDVRSCAETLKAFSEKYNTPEYLQDASFKVLFKEAYKALGNNLDTDKFVNLIEEYVSSRIYAHNLAKKEEEETQNIINSMKFDKNNSNSLQPVEKSIDDMTTEELDDYLAKYI